jgi:ADP-L-glycero-D-manno-heptose 6-epimerase
MQLNNDQLIILTGGAGLIGSAVLRCLNDQGIDNVIVVDHLGTSEKWKNLVGKKFVDILDKSQLFSWIEGKENAIKAFIHLGACSSTVESNASYLLENNYQYTLRLAQYALGHGHRFIYASSAATYGDGACGFEDNEEAIDELRPLNMYGYSKQLMDLWFKKQGVLNKVVGLKFFNVYGPNELHKGRMASAITHFVPSVRKDGVVKLFKSNDKQYPDGGQVRDFIYVKDAARMTCAFLKNDAAGLFNIGSGMARSWNDLASAVFKAMDLSPNIDYIDMPADLTGKYQNYTCAQMNKTQSVLGKEAICLPLEEGVNDYVRNYLLPGKTW